MIEKIYGLMTRYRGLLLYGIFGVFTTIVNFAVYVGCMRVLTGAKANVLSTAAAWFMAVLFAYLTNRKWVFNSKAAGFIPGIRECAAFFASRIFTGLIDLGIMYLAVDVMGYNGEVVKLLSNILVIIINYILSKFLVFRTGSKESGS